jgi:hypothetical protein
METYQVDMVRVGALQAVKRGIFATPNRRSLATKRRHKR